MIRSLLNSSSSGQATTPELEHLLLVMLDMRDSQLLRFGLISCLHTLFLISFCQLVRRKCMFMTLCMLDVVCIGGESWEGSYFTELRGYNGQCRRVNHLIQDLATLKMLTIDFYNDFPQVFFSPEIYSSDFTVPLPEVVDKCIQSAPIDTRRALYKVYPSPVFNISTSPFCAKY